ncbi:ABC transporter permease subunit [Marinicella rhabdoformis]|uniref:ABC transporter permease subunit n=1 Tax=Marinicella rhabdoformis TaxID=2580566 RepID=UPI0031B5D7C0
MQMVIQRLLWAVPVMWLILTLTFFLLRLAPGGPFDVERSLSPEIEAQIAAQYRLDLPLHDQYLTYLSGVLQGDLGPSFQYPDFTVNQLLSSGLPVSLKLGLWALLLALVCGVALGVVAAVNHKKWPDGASMLLAVVGLSVPNYVIGPLLILWLAVTWQWLPAGGWQGGEWLHMILPVVTLALPFIAYIARLMRTSLLEVWQQPYIQVAFAKGLTTRQVLWRHALKPAMLPVVSYLGPAAAALMTGSVVVEQLYGLPGLGRYFVQGALNRDYTLVMAVVLWVGLLTVLFNLIVDLLFGWLNPAIQQDQAS